MWDYPAKERLKWTEEITEKGKVDFQLLWQKMIAITLAMVKSTKDSCHYLSMELGVWLTPLNKKGLDRWSPTVNSLPITVLAHTNKYPLRHGHSLKYIRNHSQKPVAEAQSQHAFHLNPAYSSNTILASAKYSEYHPQNTLPRYLAHLRACNTWAMGNPGPSAV